MTDFRFDGTAADSTAVKAAPTTGARRLPPCFGQPQGRYTVPHPQHPDTPGIWIVRYATPDQCWACIEQPFCWDFRKLRAREANVRRW